MAESSPTAVNLQAQTAKGSYRHILKATSLLGGSSAANMLISLIRSKCVALLLGPVGMGVMGMYMNVMTLITSLSIAGMNVSAVRELAAACGSGDDDKVRDAQFTFKRLSIWLGIIGTLIMAATSWWVVDYSFDSKNTVERQEYIWGLQWLSLTVGAGLAGNYFNVLLQATGGIGRLAKLNIYSAVTSAVAAIACFYLWGRKGIVPALFIGVFLQMACSWWLARRAPLPEPCPKTAFSPKLARRLLTLGGFMVLIGLMVTAVGLLIRSIIVKKLGLDAAGLFQSASGLSLLYVNYILGAMGSDFLPRLSAVSSDNETFNRLVNQQTSIAMLLGLPGLLATISLAPLIIPILYSSEFSGAIYLLQLFSVSVFGRLLVWPLGFALIAKRKVAFSLINEVVSHAVNLTLLVYLIPKVGLHAAGYASIAIYLICPFLLYLMAQQSSKLHWTRDVWLTLVLGVVSFCLYFVLIWTKMDFWLRMGLQIGVCIGVSLYSLNRLSTMADIRIVSAIKRLLSWFKPAQN